MTRHMFYGENLRGIREEINETVEIAERMLKEEELLVEALERNARRKLHVRIGYRSLRTFCIGALKLTKNQSQRIVKQVSKRRTVTEDSKSPQRTD